MNRNAPLAPSSVPVAGTIVTHPSGSLWGTLYDWQGLESAGIAIFVGIIAAVVLNKQTRQTQRHKQDEDRRRLRAARTAMPLTLSSLYEYAEQGAAFLADQSKIARVHGNAPSAPAEMPTIPADVIPALERLVQAGSEPLSECVSDLLGDIQVFASRMRGLIRGGSKTVRPLAAADARTYLIDIAVVAARISALFDYGRRKTDEVPATPDWDDVVRSLKLLGFDASLDAQLFNAVESRKARGARVGHMGDED